MEYKFYRVDTVGDLYDKYQRAYPLATQLIAYFIFNDNDNDISDAVEGRFGERIDESILSELAFMYESSWEDNMEDIEDEVSLIFSDYGY